MRKIAILSLILLGGTVHAAKITIFNGLGRDTTVNTNANGSYVASSGNVDCGCTGIDAGAYLVSTIVGVGGGAAILDTCAKQQENPAFDHKEAIKKVSSYSLCTVASKPLKVTPSEAGACFKGKNEDYYRTIKLDSNSPIWNVDIISCSEVPAGRTIQEMK